MCYFLTIGVPAARSEALGVAFGRGFHLAEAANPAAQRAFPPGFTLRYLTQGGTCSCGLYASSTTTNRDHVAAQLRRKYGARGWSVAKVERALEQVRRHEANRDRERLHGLHPDVVQGVEAACASAGAVALVAHWYRGPVDEEPLTWTTGARCSLSELHAHAAALREDEVLLVVADDAPDHTRRTR